MMSFDGTGSMGPLDFVLSCSLISVPHTQMSDGNADAPTVHRRSHPITGEPLQIFKPAVAPGKQLSCNSSTC